MVWRIGLVGALAALLAGCLAPPAPGGAGDAAPVDVADAADAADVADVVDGGVLDRPDVPRVARDTAESDPPAIDLLSDPRNCGVPGLRCSGGTTFALAACVNGRCACSGNYAACGTQDGCSINLDTDNEHCGSCDTVCSLETQCVDGRCVPCAEGFSSCPGRSRCNLDFNDERHCGACEHACSSNERCVDRTCQTCPAPLTLCLRAACVDLQGDPANCGGCGHACGINDRCVLGRCTEVPCADPDSRHCDPASTTCSTIVSDPQNCGACGARCLDEGRTVAICSGGVCTRSCASGFASCGTSAPCSVELAFDDEHCGGCGVSCGALSHCIGGVCTSLAARPIAPLSTLMLGIQRPRFRWERAAGVDGIRLQLCADRACTRVESTRDLTGDEYRPDVALTPGVHYWRLFARRVGVVSASPSPVWEFVVPVVDTGREVVGFLYDIDGDGVEDVREGWSFRHSLAPGELQEVTLAPVITNGDVPPLVITESATLGFSGDIDGDGFGDLVGTYMRTQQRGYSIDRETRRCTVVRGGAPRFASTFNAFSIGSEGGSATGYDSMSCRFLFDLDGDGHGDIVSQTQLTRNTSDDVVWFGARRGWRGSAAPTPRPWYTFYSSMTWGDFNGDGRMDLLHTGRDGIDQFLGSVIVTSFAGGAGSPVYHGLPGCPAATAAGALSPIVTTTITVLDANRDGFDDLRVTPYPRGTATYLGGPDGITSDRCVYSLTPP